jgi:hypothetical protein
MSTEVSDYISIIVNSCGAESDIIVVLKFDKKDQALEKILKKATLKNKIANTVYEMEHKEYSFLVYIHGKIIFRKIQNKQVINNVLEDLLF